MGVLSEARQELNFRRYQKDCAAFLEDCVKIRVPGKGLVKWQLRPAQRETLDTWQAERYTITLKARQIGFSTLASGYVLWLALFHSNVLIVELSKTEREAAKLLLKSKTAYKHLPDWLKARLPKKTDDNVQKLSFDNDSVIESLPSASDPARGEAVDLVIVDEWAFLPNAEDAWASIEPITDIGGRVIGISTANGSGNFFHQFYVKAKTGVGQFKSIFYPWSAVTERDESWYEIKQGSMLPWQLHQEYPRNDEECFIRSGNTVFDYDTLQELPLEIPLAVGHLEADPISSAMPLFREHDNGEGPLTIYRFPDEDQQRQYVIGADVAEGLEHVDYSSAHVIDTLTGDVVAEWWGHIDADLFGSDVLNKLGRWYHYALVGIEVNNHGLTTCTALRDSQYPNVYYRKTYDERSVKSGRKIGWRTQANTKPLMIDELNRSIRQAEILVHSQATKVELETYVREADGKMHGSPHDDRVMGLGIANQMRKHSFTSEYVPQRHIPGSFAAMVAELDAEEARGSGFRIGQHNRRSGGGRRSQMVGAR